MRPRPDAAENDGGYLRTRSTTMRFNEAAARCRGKQDAPRDGFHVVRIASMRPRPDAAENAPSCAALTRSRQGFNEAAARCRGKRARAPRRRAAPSASMRPRPDAAENGVNTGKPAANRTLQ